MLVVNSSLLELHLGMVGITDTGVERLAEGLLHNHSLRYLDLRWYEQKPPPGPGAEPGGGGGRCAEVACACGCAVTV